MTANRRRQRRFSQYPAPPLLSAAPVRQLPHLMSPVMTRQLAVAREGARPPEDGEEEPGKARMLLKEDFSSSSSFFFERILWPNSAVFLVDGLNSNDRPENVCLSPPTLTKIYFFCRNYKTIFAPSTLFFSRN